MGQNYKTVYFSDLPADTSRQKSITLAFGQKDTDLFEKVKNLSSAEIRSLLGTESYKELISASECEDRSLNTLCHRRLKNALAEFQTQMKQFPLPIIGIEIPEQLFNPLTVTFKGGAKEPFVRWYPLLEGYSPQYVQNIINKYAPNAKKILDPFAGTGTTIFAASQLGISSYFCEINPVLQFITLTKIHVRRLGLALRIKLGKLLMERLEDLDHLIDFEPNIDLDRAYKNTFGESLFFDSDVYDKVLRLRTWIDYISCKNPFLADLITVGILSALVPASRMKRAGDLRYKNEKERQQDSPDLIISIKFNISKIAQDIQEDINGLKNEPLMACENAHSLALLPSLDIDTVITSPPYVNGTNYFRNTKIELWFLRCLFKKIDLSDFRLGAVTAGINDVTVSKTPQKLHPEVNNLVRILEKITYDIRIPRMVASYFSEITDIFAGISNHLIPGATVCIDIGDSRYAGLHVPTDKLLSACLKGLGFYQTHEVVLRTRKSRDSAPLKQSLLVFQYKKATLIFTSINRLQWWSEELHHFKKNFPHHQPPFSSRNWGHSRHSLCSFPGKLKPAIAHYLSKIFVPTGGRVLDPFAGVGTIPLEAAIQGKHAYGFDLSHAAFIIASAKLQQASLKECDEVIQSLANFIRNNFPTVDELSEATYFGFNGTVKEYYDGRTLKEIILARRYFRIFPPESPAQMIVMASLLHILHGNRPYALSRRSHPLTPYKPSGIFEYRSLIESLKKKVERTLDAELPSIFQNGKIFLQDATCWWPREINDLDAVITSPPFFDSTRFYLANWMRLWFAGWSANDFESRPLAFVEERQKQSFDVYIPILRQARERLKSGGVLVFHLGKSNKCDMASKLISLGHKWFNNAEVFNESVAHCESHGIRDKGTVTSHQYLVLY